MTAAAAGAAAIPAPRAATAVRSLALSDFRSWASLRLDVEADFVALLGPNGIGKTNILEALSLLSPGRGLRRARLDEIARVGGTGGFAVSAEILGRYGEVRLGTGLEADAAQRRYRIDREPAASATEFAEHLSVVWLTPSMDGLFTAAAGERRRFLDRLVLAVDAAHGTRVQALERALRSRNKLLEDHGADPRWLDAVEHEVAELAVAVAFARVETVSRLAALIAATARPADLFPEAAIALDGAMEGAAQSRAAVDIEDEYRRTLRGERPRDRAAGRTLSGPHLTDLHVRHRAKDIEAARCSTGEQKALLVGLVLAHARLVAAMRGAPPLVLLDEAAAHLDPARRAGLFETAAELGGQVWVTGADPLAFAALSGDCALFELSGAGAERRR